MRFWWGGVIFYLLVGAAAGLYWQSRPLPVTALALSAVETLAVQDIRIAELLSVRRLDEVTARLGANQWRDAVIDHAAEAGRTVEPAPDFVVALAAHRLVDRTLARELQRIGPELTAGQRELLVALEGQFRERAKRYASLSHPGHADAAHLMLAQAIHMQMLAQRLTDSDVHGA